MNDRLHPVMADALRGFCMPSLPSPPPCPQGELQLTLCPDWIKRPLVCRFDYSPAEPMTRDCPGSPEHIELCSAWLGDVDIALAIGDDQQSELEELALEELAYRAESARIDAYEARREER